MEDFDAMSRFVCVDRDTAYLLPPSVDEWLPQDHLARFVVEVIDRLDLDDLVADMAHRLSTQAGKALYRLRKQTVEPVFGIIKQVMGWRQVSMRGLHKAQGEWTLVTMAWNIKRMHVLRAG